MQHYTVQVKRVPCTTYIVVRHGITHDFCTLYIIQRTLYVIRRTVYSVRRTVYAVQYSSNAGTFYNSQ